MTVVESSTKFKWVGTEYCKFTKRDDCTQVKVANTLEEQSLQCDTTYNSYY